MTSILAVILLGFFRKDQKTPKLDFVNIDVCTFILRKSRGQAILTSIKSRNYVRNGNKMMRNYPNLALDTVDLHTNFRQMLFIHFQDLE